MHILYGADHLLEEGPSCILAKVGGVGYLLEELAVGSRLHYDCHDLIFLSILFALLYALH